MRCSVQVRDLVDDLSLCDESNEVFIEINGELIPVTSVFEDSQGVYIISDPDEEEREMR